MGSVALSDLEQAILAVREARPTWGARKIYAYLGREAGTCWPALSMVHAILKRNGQITPEATRAHQP